MSWSMRPRPLAIHGGLFKDRGAIRGNHDLWINGRSVGNVSKTVGRPIAGLGGG